MKTIYLIKKDPEREGKDNWRILDGAGYAAFRRTGEGRRRAESMGILPAEGEEGPCIVVECGENMRRRLGADKHRRDYRERSRKREGIRLVPFPEAGEWEAEAGFPREPGPEETVLSRLDTEKLYRVLERLDAEERELVDLLYLARRPLPVCRYAARKRISASLAFYRKAAVLEKLRGWMEE